MVPLEFPIIAENLTGDNENHQKGNAQIGRGIGKQGHGACLYNWHRRDALDTSGDWLFWQDSLMFDQRKQPATKSNSGAL